MSNGYSTPEEIIGAEDVARSQLAEAWAAHVAAGSDTPEGYGKTVCDTCDGHGGYWCHSGEYDNAYYACSYCQGRGEVAVYDGRPETAGRSCPAESWYLDRAANFADLAPLSEVCGD